jgi:predicted nucleic acid-binding protein
MNEPKRVLLDTNIYEFLLRYDFHRVKSLVEGGRIVVYGCKVIRDELRDIPRTAKYDGKSFRNLLLGIYDILVKNHSFPVENLIEVLAEEYWEEYRGGAPKRKIMPDFLIVATATIHNLDIVVSGDDKTMKSRQSLAAYYRVNEKNALETPKFVTLKELI